MADNISWNLDDYISFKTECACFDHDMYIRIEKEEPSDMLVMSISDKMYIDEIYTKNFIKRLFYRIKVALKILFLGYHEFDYEFVFKNKEHIEDFINYLNKAYNKYNHK